VKKGSKARDWTSADMPGPVSPISTTMASSSARVEMRSLPRPSIASVCASSPEVARTIW
jgi:hypothetical protein